MAPFWIFCLHVSAYLSLGLWVGFLLYRRHYIPQQFIVVAAFGVIATLYYLLFFITLGNLTWGMWANNVINLAGWAAALYGLFRFKRLVTNKTLAVSVLIPVLLIFMLTGFYSLLLSHCTLTVPTSQKHDNTTYCYLQELPGDNALPFMYAKNVAVNNDDALISDWKLVDRPPVQVGEGISVLHYGRNKIESYQIYQLVAVFLQLSWVAAVFGALLTLGLKLKQTILAVGITALSGFVFINSVFVWPKFFAAGLMIMGGFLLLDTGQKYYKRSLVPAFAAIGLSLLIHDGVLFTIAGILPVFAYCLLRNRKQIAWKPLALGAFIALLLLAPWAGYKSNHSSSDRLIKWHLAGIVLTDKRSTAQAIIDSYKELSFSKWVDYRKNNLEMLVSPIETTQLPTGIHALGFSSSAIRQSLGYLSIYTRINDFYIVFFALGLCNLGWFTLLFKRFRRLVSPLEKRLLVATALTISVWVVVMFLPRSTVIHQGSYAMMLIILMLLLSWLARARLLLALFIAQWVVFTSFWVIGVYATFDKSLHQSIPVLLASIAMAGVFLGMYALAPDIPSKVWASQKRRLT